MDTITQITLGAAVGESVLGRKIGYRAAAWGAFLGTLPDLDVIANPFLDSVGEIRLHRGITHSLLFVAVMSPLFGVMIDRIHKKLEVGWGRWSLVTALIFITHILIDVTTTYGTQVLYPFSNLPLTTDSIFIIDPFYTVPLLLGLLTALFINRESRLRRGAVRAGLLISSLYLIWGFGIKAHVHSVFDASFSHQYGYYDKIKTTPTGPGSALWTGYIVQGDTLYQSLYSISDESTDLKFRKIPRNSDLIEPYRNDRAVETLLWFSRGFYTVEKKGNDLYFFDLRFGRNDFWLFEQGDADYVWQNRILIDESGEADHFELATPEFHARMSTLSRFIDRSFGS